MRVSLCFLSRRLTTGFSLRFLSPVSPFSPRMLHTWHRPVQPGLLTACLIRFFCSFQYSLMPYEQSNPPSRTIEDFFYSWFLLVRFLRHLGSIKASEQITLLSLMSPVCFLAWTFICCLQVNLFPQSGQWQFLNQLCKFVWLDKLVSNLNLFSQTIQSYFFSSVWPVMCFNM